MIKNIVLDIGNVLIPFSWRQHLDHFGFSDEIKKRLADAVFLNDDWNEIDRGVLTKEELLARFIENDPGIEKEIYMVMENINGTVGAMYNRQKKGLFKMEASYNEEDSENKKDLMDTMKYYKENFEKKNVFNENLCSKTEEAPVEIFEDVSNHVEDLDEEKH